MNLIAYTLGQRFIMFTAIAFVAWIIPTAVYQSVPSRSCVSLAEFTAAYRAHPKFGLELGDASVRVLRIVGLTVAVIVAIPEILGML